MAERPIKIRKQYSWEYQVVELEQEVDTLEEATTVGNMMDTIAKEQLTNMVNMISASKGENNTAKSTVVKSGGTLSPKQATTIKNQYKRASQIAGKLGITLNSPQDVDNLTSKQASDIISEFFKNNKTDLGV